MPKMKTNKGAAKRLWTTGGKKIRRGSATRRHLLTSKSRERKRDLRKPGYVSEADVWVIKKLLPYG